MDTGVIDWEYISHISHRGDFESPKNVDAKEIGRKEAAPNAITGSEDPHHVALLERRCK